MQKKILHPHSLVHLFWDPSLPVLPEGPCLVPGHWLPAGAQGCHLHVPLQGIRNGAAQGRRGCGLRPAKKPAWSSPVPPTTESPSAFGVSLLTVVEA